MRLVIAVAAALLLSANGYAARTLVVDKEGGDFATVLEASKEAKPGDTVLIRSHADPLDAAGALKAGVIYASAGKEPETLALKDREGVTLSGFRFRSLTLEGCKGVVVEKSGFEGGALTIKRSEGVTARGCAFVAPDAKAAQARVRVEASNKTTLEDNLIQASWIGVLLVDAEDALLRRNTIVGAHYTGRKLDPADLAEAHDALTASEAVLVQCGVTMMEAWDRRAAKPAEFAENVIASNERGIIVDRCAKGSSALKAHHNLFFENGKLDFVEVKKKYEGANFSYVLEDVLAKERMDDAGNKSLDPLFAGPTRGDFSLTPQSPGVRMGKDGGAVGAPAETASKGAFAAPRPPLSAELRAFVAKESVMADAAPVPVDPSWPRAQLFERCKAAMTPVFEASARRALLDKVRALPYSGGATVGDAMKKDEALKAAVERGAARAPVDAYSIAVNKDYKSCRATVAFGNGFKALADE